MVKVFVMKTCPDCTKIEEQVKNDSRFKLIDIGEHVRNLKHFLALRDHNPAFDSIKRNGSIGIPCFLLEDGSITFSEEEVDLSGSDTGASCRLDGKGC